jgi:hypothetical protein
MKVFHIFQSQKLHRSLKRRFWFKWMIAVNVVIIELDKIMRQNLQ